MGDDAPPNLVTNICDTWDPAGAVNSLLEDPVYDRAAFLQLQTDAEAMLRHCDDLRLALPADGVGVKLTNVLPGTLAAILGFEVGDLVLSVNDADTTDYLAMMAVIMDLSQENDLAVIKYQRGGVDKTLSVRIQ